MQSNLNGTIAYLTPNNSSYARSSNSNGNVSYQFDRLSSFEGCENNQTRTIGSNGTFQDMMAKI
jgi:hypothetical protein